MSPATSKADQVARQLIELQSGYDRDQGPDRLRAERKIANAQGEIAEAKKEKDSARIEKAQKVIEPRPRRRSEAASAKLEQADAVLRGRVRPQVRST